MRLDSYCATTGVHAYRARSMLAAFIHVPFRTTVAIRHAIISGDAGGNSPEQFAAGVKAGD
jgi:hypothetical protein